MRLADLTSRLDDEELRGLLRLSVFDPTGEKTGLAIAEYRNDPRSSIFGIESDEELVALIGLKHDFPHEASIRHMAVRPNRQRAGLGRAMISMVRERLKLDALTAETDGDAVGFYQRCGFEVQSLGEKYPETERFSCELRRF